MDIIIDDILTIDPATIDSIVLQRLIREVQQGHDAHGGLTIPRAYDRVHNRHNRGPNHPRPTPEKPRP